MPVKRLVVAAGLMSLSCFGQQPAAKPQPAPKAQTQTKKDAPGVAQGIVAVKDPETGAIRQATAAEIGALGSTAPVADAAPSVVVVSPDGSRSVLVGADTQVFTVVTKTADGKLVTAEVVGEKNAAAVVKSPSVAPAPTGELQ